MLYKPNYCCSCGEKIERVEWNLLTSRRFCTTCAIENRRFDYIPRTLVTAGALAVMFSLGSLWGGTEMIEQQSSALPATAFKSSVQKEDPRAPVAADPVQPATHVQLGPSGQSHTVQAEVAAVEPKRIEVKFFCGALTKKGTPCSRKVKVKGGRCYQHEGRPEAPPLN